MVPSLLSSVEQGAGRYTFHLYVGYDEGDPVFDNAATLVKLRCGEEVGGKGGRSTSKRACSERYVQRVVSVHCNHNASDSCQLLADPRRHSLSGSKVHVRQPISLAQPTQSASRPYPGGGCE